MSDQDFKCISSLYLSKDVGAVVTSVLSQGKVPLVHLVDTGGGKPLSHLLP